MVVILGHVGHDAEAVGDAHGDHVIGVQKSRDPQLLLSHFKGLGGGGRGEGRCGGGARCRGGGRCGGGDRSSHSRKRRRRQVSGCPSDKAKLPSVGWGDQGRGGCGPHNDLEKGEARYSRHPRARGKKGLGRGAARDQLQGRSSGSWSRSLSSRPASPLPTPPPHTASWASTCLGTHQTVILEDIVLGKRIKISARGKREEER